MNISLFILNETSIMPSHLEIFCYIFIFRIKSSFKIVPPIRVLVVFYKSSALQFFTAVHYIIFYNKQLNFGGRSPSGTPYIHRRMTDIHFYNYFIKLSLSCTDNSRNLQGTVPCRFLRLTQLMKFFQAFYSFTFGYFDCYFN